MALPAVGVKLVAEDAANFDKALRTASSTLSGFGGVAVTASKTVNAALSGLASQAAGALKPIGAVLEQVFIATVRTLTRQAIRAVEDFIGSLAEAAIKGSLLEDNMGRLRASLDQVSKVTLAPLVNEFAGIVEEAAPAFLGFVQFAEQQFVGLAANAQVWGENVINSFAQGLWNAVGSILDALSSIASLITYYLAPGSPPRLLPDLDQWGTAAANEFFGAWGKADFSVFDEIAGTVSNLIRSMPLPKGAQLGVVPAILGARQGIAQAVEELRTTGAITQSTMDAIVASVGGADDSVRGYLESMVRLQAANDTVAEAQAELNRVTEAYKALLKPVEAELAGITEEQQQLADEQKKSLLQLVLADPNSSAAAKRQAQLEIERLDAEKRRRALLAEGKAAVDAAGDKLDAAKTAQGLAQSEFEARKALILAQTEQNNLLKEQLRLLESLEKREAAARGGAGGSGGGTRPQPFGIKPFDLGDFIPDSIMEKWGAFVTAFEGLWKRIVEVMQPAIDAWDNAVVPAWNRLVKAFTDSIPDLIANISAFGAFAIGLFGTALPAVFTLTGVALSILAQIWTTHHNTILSVTRFTFEGILLAISVSMTLLFAGTVLILLALQTAFNVFAAVAKGDIEGVGKAFDDFSKASTVIMNYTFGEVLKQVLFFFGKDTQDLEKIWNDSFTAMKNLLNDTIKPNIESALQGIASAFGGPRDAVQFLLDKLKELYEWLASHTFSFPSYDIPGITGGGGGGGVTKTVSAPPTSSPMASVTYASSTTGGNITYAPTYIGTAPPAAQGFATIAALVG